MRGGHRQCDQIVRLFLNIWPFATITISLIMSQICQSRLSILPNKKLTVKYFLETCKLLQKWRNFASSGHTDQRWNLIIGVKDMHWGGGCGSVGRTVAYNTRGPRFESSHRKNFICTFCQLIEKSKINKTGPWNGPIKKYWAIYWTLGNFSEPLAAINLPKLPTFLGNFCKGVKMFNLSSEIIFGQFL